MDCAEKEVGGVSTSHPTHRRHRIISASEFGHRLCACDHFRCEHELRSRVALPRRAPQCRDDERLRGGDERQLDDALQLDDDGPLPRASSCQPWNKSFVGGVVKAESPHSPKAEREHSPYQRFGNCRVHQSEGG